MTIERSQRASKIPSAYLPRLALLLCVVWIGRLSGAFYAFENVKIDQRELQSTSECDIVTTKELIAYSCTDYLKIFLSGSLESKTPIYYTTKAVAQIRASKLDSDPFISFIEARTEEDVEPAAYAYLRVVDKTGLRELGVTYAFLPNRSIYLGGRLILRVNQAYTNLQVYNLDTLQTSTFINILNQQLTFDYYPIDAEAKKWAIGACQKDNQQCYFYTLDKTMIKPKTRNTVSERCPKAIELIDDYVVLACFSVKSLSLYQLSSSYVMSRRFFMSGIDNNDAKMVKFDSTTSMIHYTKNYPWSTGQTEPLTFIDSIFILRESRLSKPLAIKFEQDFFYELHADQTYSWDYKTHITGLHSSPNLAASYGKIVKFSVASPDSLTIIAQNDNSQTYELHQTQLCGLNAIRFKQKFDQTCYTPYSGQFIDWAKMEPHGLIQMTDCDTSDSLSDVQKILRARACPSYTLSSSTVSAQSYAVKKRHVELEPAECDSQRFPIGGHCVSCGPLCTNCSFPNTNYLVHGFYLNGQNAQGTCASCASNAIISSSTGQCECRDTYYLDSASDSCAQCSWKCARCSSYDVCDKCQNDFVVAGDGSCRFANCPDGTYLDNTIEQCVNCHSSCATCSADGSRCLTCPNGLSVGATICLSCDARQTIEGDGCVSCGSACLECSSRNTCTRCEGQAYLSNGSCVCKDGYFMDTTFGTCKSCSPSCATCDSEAACKTCPPGLSLGATRCLQCATNEYVRGDSCFNCGANCAQCSDGPNQCQVCSTGSILQSDGTCACEAGRYFNSALQTCDECHGSCETCLGPNKCATCPQGTTLGNTICLSCAEEEYPSGDLCLNCGKGCLSCDSGPNQCKQCVVNSGLRQDGKCECLTGHFYNSDDNSCGSCNPTCLTCSEASTCLTCRPGFVKGPTGLCECGAGTYLDSITQTCKACDATCATCSSGDRCDTCPARFTLGDTKCLKCAQNEYLEGDTCVSCGFECNQCETGPNQCQECSLDSDLEFGACFCKTGTFRDQLS